MMSDGAEFHEEKKLSLMKNPNPLLINVFNLINLHVDIVELIL